MQESKILLYKCYCATRPFNLINSEKMGGLVKSIFTERKLTTEFNFLQLVGKYESLKEGVEKNKLREEIFKIISEEKLNIPDSLQNMTDADDKINEVKEHLLDSANSNFKLELKAVLESGEKLKPTKKQETSNPLTPEEADPDDFENIMKNM